MRAGSLAATATRSRAAVRKARSAHILTCVPCPCFVVFAVLLDAEGHIRLSDFGLAGDLNLDADGMTIGACGTSGYMAQELLANMRYDTTPDVYALGVLMYRTNATSSALQLNLRQRSLWLLLLLCV